MRPLRPLLRASLAAALALAGTMAVAGPAAASAPRGSFLNPSVDGSGNGPGTVISTQDGASTYRFSVRTDPALGTTITGVRIQVEEPGSTTWTDAGDASRVGSSDTWQLRWNPAGVSDGDGAVRAVLTASDGATAYVPAETGQAVHFDSSAPAATLRVSRELGFPKGTARLTGTVTSDTTDLSAYYTTAPARGPVSWVPCGTTESFSSDTNGGLAYRMGCALAGSQTPKQVTAVSVVPSNVVVPLLLETQGAGDAVRVSGYGLPASLTLSPKTATRSLGSAQTEKARVRDAYGDGVPGVRVRFALTGVARARRAAMTGPTGVATFRFEAARPGRATVVATAGKLSKQATILWTKAPTRLSIHKSPSGTTAPGQTVTAAGTLSSPASFCSANRVVILATSTRRIVARTRTSATGSYRFSGRPRRSVAVYAVFAGTSRCRPSRSSRLDVPVA